MQDFFHTPYHTKNVVEICVCSFHIGLCMVLKVDCMTSVQHCSTFFCSDSVIFWLHDEPLNPWGKLMTAKHLRDHAVGHAVELGVFKCHQPAFRGPKNWDPWVSINKDGMDIQEYPTHTHIYVYVYVKIYINMYGGFLK